MKTSKFIKIRPNIDFYTTDQPGKILGKSLLYGWKGNFLPIPMLPELLKSDVGLCFGVCLKLKFIR